MSLSDLKISKKLGLGFGAILIVVLSLTAVVWSHLRAIDAATHETNESYETIAAVDRAAADLVKEQTTLRGYLLTQNKETLPDIDRASADFDKTIVEVSALLKNDTEEHQRLDRLANAGRSYKTDVTDPELKLAVDPATIGKALDMVKSGKGIRLKPALDAAREMHEVEARQIVNSKATLLSAFHSSRMALFIGATLSLLGAIFIGWLLSRTIAGPVAALTTAMRCISAGDTMVAVPALRRKDEIGKMADALLVFKQNALEKATLETEAAEQRRLAEEVHLRNEADRAATAEKQAHVVDSVAAGLAKLSSGDLTYRIETVFVPEYEKLRDDFNAAMGQLEETIAFVAGTTQEIRSGAGQISTAADDLSRRTEQQAANLEETAAALDQITATVQKTAMGASHANDAVVIVQDNAVQGRDVVRDAASAMSEIEKSSKEIAQIIGIIDEIAFQTNLLALNAGIEAARAGDAGRGFAVIATEVRALAQRSAESGKEIKTLISSSIQQVDKGVDLVGESGKVLQRIANQVAEINEVVSEIAASTKEQATGLTQVNQAVNQMDQMTQQNAAMVEESTAASHSLVQETEQLVQLIRRFQVGQEIDQQPVQRHPAVPAHKLTSKPKEEVRHNRRKAPRPPVLKALSGGPAPHRQPADEEGWSEF